MLGVGALTFAGTLTAMGAQVPWKAMTTALMYFPVNYLFLGSLILGTASLGSNMKQSQQFISFWILIAMSPMFMLPILIQQPHGTLGQVTSWIPFTSPIVVLMRIALGPDEVPWWQILGPWLVMIASTWFALRLGARLFRIGLLLRGGTPKVREIWRQARLSA